MPTLVVAGSDDVITPEPARCARWRPGFANSEFVVLPGVGHLTAVEAPVEFNAVLARFLAQRVADAGHRRG